MCTFFWQSLRSTAVLLCLSSLKATKILREEISYRWHISTRDFQERPQLYRVNQISVIEMKVNLRVLLTNAEIDVEETTTLPTEEEIMNTLVGEDITCQTPHSGNAGHQESMNANHTDPGKSAADNTFSEPVINEPCIVIWDEASDRNVTWQCVAVN